jgi:serine/threonine protein kinase
MNADIKSALVQYNGDVFAAAMQVGQEPVLDCRKKDLYKWDDGQVGEGAYSVVKEIRKKDPVQGDPPFVVKIITTKTLEIFGDTPDEPSTTQSGHTKRSLELVFGGNSYLAKKFLYALEDFKQEVEIAILAGNEGFGPVVEDAWWCENQGEIAPFLMKDPVTGFLVQRGTQTPTHSYYIVMENLKKGRPGESKYKEWMERGEQDNIEHWKTVLETLDAFSKATHRVYDDIHDENILWDDDMTKIKLIDFGRTKPLAEDDTERAKASRVFARNVLRRIFQTHRGVPTSDFLRDSVYRSLLGTNQLETEREDKIRENIKDPKHADDMINFIKWIFYRFPVTVDED